MFTVNTPNFHELLPRSSKSILPTRIGYSFRKLKLHRMHKAMVLHLLTVSYAYEYFRIVCRAGIGDSMEKIMKKRKKKKEG